MEPDPTPQPLLMVSSDGHVGPPVEAYRDYVEARHRDDFERWLASYVPLWKVSEPQGSGLTPTLSEGFKRHWMGLEEVPRGLEAKSDPRARLAILDEHGFAADVLFPDDQSANSPPFLGLARDFNRPWDGECPPELKAAGARAYNRWLAEFCSEAPDRLLGVALLGSVADVEGAVEEVRWARRNGLRGVLLPLFYYNTSEAFWNDRRYDPLWAACAELDMPVHSHNGPGSPNYGNGVDGPMLYGIECTYWPRRPLWFLIVGGALERHPDLKLIFTECGSMWVLEALAMLDFQVADPRFAYCEHEVIRRKPSEYFQRQCWLGASLISRPEIEQRHAIGLDKLMWGWDLPHIESPDWLQPRRQLRELLQGVPEEEVRAILAGNALEAYSLDVARLRPIAQRIGPAAGEIVTA